MKLGRMVPRSVSVLASLLIVGIVAACDAKGIGVGDAFRQQEKNPRLGEAIMSIYLSTDSSSWDDHAAGYVLLVDRDGTYRTVRTKGMDAASMVWDRAGLHFSDTANDYRLDRDGLRTIPSAKTNYQWGMLPVGDSVVGVYNRGVESPGSYTTEIVVTHGNQSAKSLVEGNFGALASCGEELFGIAEATGQYRTGHQDPGGRGEWLLAKIWPGDQEIVGSSDRQLNTGWNFSGAPCVDGVIYHLTGVQSGPGNVKVELVEWSAKDGRRAEIPVRVGQRQLEFESESFAFAAGVPGWVVGRKYLWMSSDGVVRATDLESGATTKVLATGLRLDNRHRVQPFLAGNYLYVVSDPFGDPSEEISLLRFDLRDGSVKRIVTLAGVNSKHPADVVTRGAALSPDLLAGETR